MIDFRYHLVSLIAVFLAIALGIVIGTTALNEPILSDVEDRVAALEQDKRALEDQTQTLQAQLDTTDAFAQAVAPALVEGSLTGRSVLLVLATEEVPQETVEEVTALVGEAGGTVSGTLALQPGYSDPSSESALQSYVTGSGLPTGVTLPETEDTGRLVAGLLGSVLMIPPDPVADAPEAAEVSSVVAGLVSLDVLAQVSSEVAPADYAVVLTQGGFDGDDAAERNSTLVELVTALDAAGSGAVVAGDGGSAGATGLVGAVRGDPALSAAVSTVDNVASTSGQISTVLALGTEGEGTSGQYGVGEDTQPVPPLPVAAP